MGLEDHLPPRRHHHRHRTRRTHPALPQPTQTNSLTQPPEKGTACPHAQFGYLRTNLELTAGNLSQHLGVLEGAGLITIEKGYVGKRPRTWITLTKAGHAALAGEITKLKLLISRVERADIPPG